MISNQNPSAASAETQMSSENVHSMVINAVNVPVLVLDYLYSDWRSKESSFEMSTRRHAVLT